MTPNEIKAGQSAVALVTLYREWVMDRSSVEPTLEEFMLVLDPDPDQKKALIQVMDVNAALVAMVIALLEHSEESDELLQIIASTYQEDPE